MSMLRNIFTVGSGGAAAQLVAVAAIPLITRLYDPRAYAGWALLMSVVVIVSSLAAFRYELAVVLPATHEEAAPVFAGCLVVTVAVSGLAGVFLAALAPWLFGDTFYGELRPWLWVVPVLVVATGFYLASNAWFTRTEQFALYSFSQVMLPLFTAAGQILSALMGDRTASGLIAGTMAGHLLSVGLLLGFLMRRSQRRHFAAVSPQEIRHALRKYKAYPLYMTPYTLVGCIRDRLIYFLMAAFGGRPDLAYYNLSSTVVNAPNSLVSSAMRPIFFQKAASTDVSKLEGMVNRALRVLAACAVPLWILFLFHSQAVFGFVFGDHWREAGLYGAILSFPAIPLLLGNWLDRTFDSLGRQRTAFALEMTFSGLSVGILTVGMLLYRDSLIAVSLQSGVLTLYYAYWLRVLYRVAGFSSGALSKLACGILAAALACCLVSGLLAWALPDGPAILVNAIFAIACTGFYLRREIGLARA